MNYRIIPTRSTQLQRFGSFVSQPELFANDSAERVGDLSVSRDRGLLPVCWVAVEVMPFPMPYERAPGRLQFPDKVLSLHTSSSTSCRCAAGGAAGRSCVTISS